MPQMDLFGNVAVLTLDDGPDVTESEPPPPKRGRGRGHARSRSRLVGAGGGTASGGGNPATDGADAAAVGDGRASEVAGSTASGSGGGHRAEVYLEGVPPPSRVEPEGVPSSPRPELGVVPTTTRPELEGVPTTPRVEPGEIVTTFSTDFRHRHLLHEVRLHGRPVGAWDPCGSEVAPEFLLQQMQFEDRHVEPHVWELASRRVQRHRRCDDAEVFLRHRSRTKIVCRRQSKIRWCHGWWSSRLLRTVVRICPSRLGLMHLTTSTPPRSGQRHRCECTTSWARPTK